MFRVFSVHVAVSALLAIQAFGGRALAGDLKIPIPQRSFATPSQKLNREGVAELKRGHREKAKRLFYRAYLMDPQDPFTLNNLGYVAELDGDADRALRFYGLAAKDHTGALIDRSSEAQLRGKPLDAAFRQVQESNREVSKINEQASVLLQQGKVFEARNLLFSSLSSHPDDPFLLNNLGYAMESIGDLEGALKYYSAAASLHSTESVVITPRAKWRGRPISEVASENEKAVAAQMAHGEGGEALAARLNLRGVAALNDNNPSQARTFFLQAYRQDSQNAFTLNNLGYLAELDGDLESAESYYAAARSGGDARDRVTYSTRHDAEGKKVDDLADTNQLDVQGTLKAMQQARRRAPQPVELMQRNGHPENGDPNTKPVPPVGIEAPSLPALPPPDSNQQQK